MEPAWAEVQWLPSSIVTKTEIAGGADHSLTTAPESTNAPWVDEHDILAEETERLREGHGAEKVMELREGHGAQRRSWNSVEEWRYGEMACLVADEKETLTGVAALAPRLARPMRQPRRDGTLRKPFPETSTPNPAAQCVLAVQTSATAMHARSTTTAIASTAAWVLLAAK